MSRRLVSRPFSVLGSADAGSVGCSIAECLAFGCFAMCRSPQNMLARDSAPSPRNESEITFTNVTVTRTRPFIKGLRSRYRIRPSAGSYSEAAPASIAGAVTRQRRPEISLATPAADPALPALPAARYTRAARRRPSGPRRDPFASALSRRFATTGSRR